MGCIRPFAVHLVVSPYLGAAPAHFNTAGMNTARPKVIIFQLFFSSALPKNSRGKLGLMTFGAKYMLTGK